MEIHRRLKKSECRTCDREVSKIRQYGRRIFGRNVVVSNESNPTLASLRNRVRGQKIRSVIEVYDQNEEVDQVLNIAFIACDPADFDEVVKKDVWIK